MPTNTPIAQDPAIALVKTGVYNAGAGTITYTYTITNEGDVILNGPFTVTAPEGVAVCAPAPAVIGKAGMGIVGVRR